VARTQAPHRAVDGRGAIAHELAAVHNHLDHWPRPVDGYEDSGTNC